ncbi:peptide chain release factor-like protein [Aestuariibaculum sediminum]|uniref:peptide chain release factor-like protein n=1 Tax=Aestuariibaculum sediminum TaxID=2770637 RepID=UPI00293BC466|nr:peptide chain release factor-like protein [Aestuariibaculum sediminum]
MFDKERLINELNFKAVRSSGSGGQHVNKVASKVELYFDLKNSEVFNDHLK